MRWKSAMLSEMFNSERGPQPLMDKAGNVWGCTDVVVADVRPFPSVIASTWPARLINLLSCKRNVALEPFRLREDVDEVLVLVGGISGQDGRGEIRGLALVTVEGLEGLLSSKVVMWHREGC
jgi:hypothetical protein